MTEETSVPSAEHQVTTSTGQAVDLETVNVDTLDVSDTEKERIKGFQADYTRKTQQLAQQRKEVEARMAEAEKWQDWYSTNQSSIDEFNRWKEEQVNKTVKEASHDEVYDGVEDVGKLKAAITKEFDAKLSTVQRQYANAMKEGYETIKDLVEIKLVDPDVDWQKVVDTMRKENITSARKAYSLAYNEKITQKKIDEAKEQFRKEIEEKAKTQVLSAQMAPGREVRKVINPKPR
jgi:hypothetical protein